MLTLPGRCRRLLRTQHKLNVSTVTELILGGESNSPQEVGSPAGRQAKPTNDFMSKWAVDECSVAKASQLRVALRLNAPT